MTLVASGPPGPHVPALLGGDAGDVAAGRARVHEPEAVADLLVRLRHCGKTNKNTSEDSPRDIRVRNCGALDDIAEVGVMERVGLDAVSPDHGTPPQAPPMGVGVTGCTGSGPECCHFTPTYAPPIFPSYTTFSFPGYSSPPTGYHHSPSVAQPFLPLHRAPLPCPRGTTLSSPDTTLSSPAPPSPPRHHPLLPGATLSSPAPPSPPQRHPLLPSATLSSWAPPSPPRHHPLLLGATLSSPAPPSAPRRHPLLPGRHPRSPPGAAVTGRRCGSLVRSLRRPRWRRQVLRSGCARFMHFSNLIVCQ